jgi:hypothetical protein
MSSGVTEPAAGTGDSGADVRRLPSEPDVVKAQVSDPRRPARNGVGRRTVLGVLVVLFTLLVPILATAAWTHRTVLDTDTFVGTVAPIADDPAVQAAVSRQVTDQLYAALQPQQIVADALPPKAAFLAGPITNGSKQYVQQGVDHVISSSQFQQIWVAALTFAHSQLVSALRGHTDALDTTNGVVVLDLVPVLNATLQQVQGFATSVVGHPITLPTLTGDELPAEACRKISVALDRPLPATCGQVPLFPSHGLSTAQRVVRAFDRSIPLLLVLTPLVAIAALVISRRRRRTLLQLTIGAMLGLVIIRRATFWTRDDLISLGRPENKAARTSILHYLLQGFFGLTEWLLIAGIVVVVVALVTGPYRWAVRLREHLAGGAKVGSTLVSDAVAGPGQPGKDDAALAWVRQHLDALRVGGVVVAILLLIVVDMTAGLFLGIAAVLAVYELLLHRLRGPSEIVLQ